MDMIGHDAVNIHPAGRLLLLLQQTVDGNAGISAFGKGAAGSAANREEAGLSGLGVSAVFEASVPGVGHGAIIPGVNGRDQWDDRAWLCM
jgi:hypothetical protein